VTHNHYYQTANYPLVELILYFKAGFLLAVAESIRSTKVVETLAFGPQLEFLSNLILDRITV